MFFARIIYFIISIVQFLAIYDGVKEWTGLWDWASIIVSFILSLIPLIGTIVGIWAAMDIWDWSFFKAIIIFLWPIVYFVLAVVYYGISDLLFNLFGSSKGGAVAKINNKDEVIDKNLHVNNNEITLINKDWNNSEIRVTVLLVVLILSFLAFLKFGSTFINDRNINSNHANSSNSNGEYKNNQLNGVDNFVEKTINPATSDKNVYVVNGDASIQADSLDENQIKACLYESYRISGARSVLNKYNKNGHDIFNDMVDDYNSKCSGRSYSDIDFLEVKADAEKFREYLESEGVMIIERSDSSHENSDEVKIDEHQILESAVRELDVDTAKTNSQKEDLNNSIRQLDSERYNKKEIDQNEDVPSVGRGLLLNDE